MPPSLSIHGVSLCEDSLLTIGDESGNLCLGSASLRLDDSLRPSGDGACNLAARSVSLPLDDTLRIIGDELRDLFLVFVSLPFDETLRIIGDGPAGLELFSDLASTGGAAACPC